MVPASLRWRYARRVMSREERRAYERMNRGRDPFAPPLSREAKARLERQKQRRDTRRRPAGTAAAAGGPLSGRFARWVVAGFVGIGLTAFSLAWPQGMPTALYIGLAAGVAWVVLAYIVRAVARRASAGGGLERRP